MRYINTHSFIHSYVEYKECQTKNHQGDEGSSRKRARKSVQHQNMENRWRRGRSISTLCRVCQPSSSRLQSSWNFFLTPVDGPTTNVLYKAVPVGPNTLAEQMKTIAYIASLDGKFTNSSGHKTVIQSLPEDFHPLEISELTSHANP